MADDEQEKPKKKDSDDSQQQQPERETAASAARNDQVLRSSGLDAERVTQEKKDQDAASQRAFEEALVKGAAGGVGAGRGLATATELLAGADPEKAKDGKGKRRDGGDRSAVVGDAAERPSDVAVKGVRDLISRNMSYPGERHAIAGAERRLAENAKNLPPEQREAYGAIGSALVRGDSAALQRALQEYGKDPSNPALKGAVEALNKDLKGAGLSLEYQPGTKKEGDKDATPGSLKIKTEGDGDRTVTVGTDGKMTATKKVEGGTESPLSADDTRRMTRDVALAARI